eukprot:TRINITY_DN39392_c0_g1_i1.p1 TRINITY_DN39392_c0_g1~~TRINITY_DN39392_c0_g1_i1.p1  ORF type:complete len:109 (-),score=7.30 TRINITY_DN39392_c0_g1_i1:12-338(-)
MWFGPAGTVSPLHCDPYNNILCQVVGCKRIALFPPSCTPSLYPHSGEEQLANTSQVDYLQPDLARFPLFRKTTATELVLSAGQALYIPKGWWHWVQSETASISLSFWK